MEFQRRDVIIRQWYETHYNSVTASADGSSIQRYLHLEMERPFGVSRTFSRTLEVGGNRGEHIPFVRHRFDEYWLTDLYPPEVPSNLSGDKRIRTCVCDAAEIPFGEGAFDRVIVTCLMHHVEDPLRVFYEVRRVTRLGGEITIMIPTDPSLAYRLGVWLSSRRAARRRGLQEEMYLVKALDHRNHYRSIATQATHAFRGDDVRCRYLPFRIPSIEFNAFTVWHITRTS